MNFVYKGEGASRRCAMEDLHIIELYWQRNESAIKESQTKYDGYCSTIANNILHSAEDTEECVNDTWLRAWNTMPPEKPSRLAVFLGKITRILAIDKYRKDRSQKYQGNRMKNSRKFIQNNGTEEVIIKGTAKAFCFHTKFYRGK